MREFRFRAWDKNQKKMLIVSEISFRPHNFVVSGIESEEKTMTIYTSHSPHVDLMQFTGLKDKNGKEIYEGDIVTLAKINFKTMGSAIAQVIYKSPTFILWNEINASNDFSLVVEVIGNIYENPELLK